MWDLGFDIETKVNELEQILINMQFQNDQLKEEMDMVLVNLTNLRPSHNWEWVNRISALIGIFDKLILILQANQIIS